MDRGYGKVWLGQARPALRHDVQRSERRGPGQRIRRIRLGRVYRSDLRRGLRRIHAQAARRPDRIRQTSSDRSQGLGLRALRSGRQLSVERRQVLRTGGPGPVGRPMRSQAGRPAADSERSEKKHAIGLVRVTAGNGRAARTSSPRPVRAVVGRRFPVARMG